jgi:hypothetical protein
MFRKGKKVWLTAALGLVLLLAASPGRAAARLWQVGSVPGWEELWEKVWDWFGSGGHGAAAAVDRNGWEKSSAGIDPDGQPVPASSTQSDSSAGIDPLGKP